MDPVRQLAAASSADGQAPPPASPPEPSSVMPSTSLPPPLPPHPASGLALSQPDEQMAHSSTTTPPAVHLLTAASPPPRKGTNSSISTQSTLATMASAETNPTSYSADTPPNLHQSIFSVKDGSDVSNNRRPSRRRTGPLSQQSRERAALIRKLGACNDCRRRRVACHPSHHNMTWEDVMSKFHRSHSPTIHDMTQSLAGQRPLSPTSHMSIAQSMFAPDAHTMDIDPSTPSQHQHGRPHLSEARLRTPLPSAPGPRLEKSHSLPGIESLRNDLQANASRMITTSSRNRYTAVHALLLFWQDDEDIVNTNNTVRELAETLEKYYHYSIQTQSIPGSSSDGTRSSWRWLSRLLNDFAEDNDQRDVLKIVYYIGYTYLDGHRDMVLASSRDSSKTSIIRWHGIQTILEEACADTLIIMDATYFPSLRIIRERGVLEVIAASVSDEHYSSLERGSFTKTLAEILRTRASRSTPLSAAELHSLVLAEYPKMAQEKNPELETVTSFPAPLHVLVSGNSRLPSIYMCPVPRGSPLRTGFSYENNPQLHLSIRLSDDNVDVDTWNEWLRLMPEGVKDVKVEGPYRPAFR